jgi:glycolate oxidase FAD binding subunit
MGDLTTRLQQAVCDAAARKQPLRLHGGDSKAFYGNPVDGVALDLREHNGVIGYEPTELVLTARGGTPLRELEAALTQHGQHLSCEPPYFGGEPTLGGMVASGLAGPNRPWGGAVRDQVLGVKLLDGQGRVLNFGGQVMKNVAGYDVARLMSGAHGTLGILLEISLKVLPRPAKTRTVVLELSREKAHKRMRELARRPIPLAGVTYLDGRLFLRLSGAHASVNAWRERLGGERLAEHSTFWQRLRDLQLDFFSHERTLWRLSLPGNAPRLTCEHQAILDWAGAQRWVYSDTPAQDIHAQAAAVGGHAEAFRRPDDTSPGNAAALQAPLPPLMQQLHRGLKQRFDPHGLFNPGRLFSE